MYKWYYITRSLVFSLILTLAELELVENGCLSCRIKTNHENSHLLLAELYFISILVGGGAWLHVSGC